MLTLLVGLALAITSADPVVAYGGLIIALVALVLSIYNFVKANVPIIKVKHSIAYSDYESIEPQEEYDQLIVTYVRGTVPIAFDESAFFSLERGWSHYPIFPPESPDATNRTLIISYAPETLYPSIVGCAVRSLDGKWRYSDSLKREYKNMNFKPKPMPERDPNDPFPF